MSNIELRTGTVSLLKEIRDIIYSQGPIKKDEISLFDLCQFYKLMHDKIEDEMDNLRQSITDLSKNFRCQVADIYSEQDTITIKFYKDCYSYIDIKEEDQVLVYKKIGNQVCLIKGPSNFDSSIYKINQILLTEHYKELKTIYALNVFKESVSDIQRFTIKPWQIILSNGELELSIPYNSQNAINREYAFYVKVNGDNKSLVCGFPEVAQTLVGKEAEFLRGYTINTQFLNEETRYLLQQYMEEKKNNQPIQNTDSEKTEKIENPIQKLFKKIKKNRSNER